MDHLDVMFFIQFINNSISITKIKKLDDKYWSHFDSAHWTLDVHPTFFQTFINSKINFKRKTLRLKFRLSKEQVPNYFDESARKFKFNGCYLEVGDGREYVVRKDKAAKNVKKSGDGRECVGRKDIAAKNVKQPDSKKAKKCKGLNQLVFKPSTTSPREFIKQFEDCFPEKNSDELKQALSKFIPKADKVHFSDALLNDEYEQVKEMFVHKYVHQYADKRYNDLHLNIADYSKLSIYAQVLIKNFKIHHKNGDACDFVLGSLPANLYAQFELKRVDKTEKAILNFMKTLDDNQHTGSNTNGISRTEQVQTAVSFDTPSTTHRTATDSVSRTQSRKRAFPRTKDELVKAPATVII